MACYPPEDTENYCAICNEGNRLWLENRGSSSVSVAVTVGSATSSVLPQTADAPTMLCNTVPNSGGPLTIDINGQTATALENLDPNLISRPEDVTVGLITAPRGAGNRPIANESRGIPVRSAGNEVSLSDFLSDGVTEGNTEIDMVMVCEAAQGSGAITSEGAYNVNDLSDAQLSWLSSSIAQNTISNVGNEAGQVALFAREVSRGNRGQVVAALRELIFEGRFYVKSISSWGGRFGIIFKGAHRSRSFLTAISYGLRNGKMSYVSSYADVMAAQAAGGSGVSQAARGVAKGNFIGFVIAAAFDVNDFFQSEDPEKNWGDLLGALSVTFVKVWVAGFVGVLLAGAIASAAVAAGVAAVPVVLVVGLGVGIAIGVGFLLDKLDDWLGVKESARRMGRAFAGAINRGLRSAAAFIERIATAVDSTIDGWFRDFEESLRRNDPNGWCALFCGNQLDQADAWMRGLTGRGINWP